MELGSSADAPLRLASLPRTAAVIQHAMRALPFLHDQPHASAENRENLNAIVRRYHPGEGIPFHVDYHVAARNEKHPAYEEPVYGCILLNTSDSQLVFRHGKEVRASPEPKGCIFLMTGASRFACQHGVPALRSGQRISLTWRWTV